MKRWMTILLAAMLSLAPLTAEAKGFGGGFSSKISHSSYSSRSTGSSFFSSGSSTTYHSGYKAPSSNVSRSYSSSSTYNQASSRSGGFLSHAASFGAGALLGSMFHPFGGYYGGFGGGGYHSFSVFGLLFDLLLVYIGFKILRRLF